MINGQSSVYKTQGRKPLEISQCASTFSSYENDGGVLEKIAKWNEKCWPSHEDQSSTFFLSFQRNLPAFTDFSLWVYYLDYLFMLFFPLNTFHYFTNRSKLDRMTYCIWLSYIILNYILLLSDALLCKYWWWLFFLGALWEWKGFFLSQVMRVGMVRFVCVQS